MAFVELGGSSAERRGYFTTLRGVRARHAVRFQKLREQSRSRKMRRFAREENTVVIRRPEYSHDIGESRDCMAIGPPINGRFTNRNRREAVASYMPLDRKGAGAHRAPRLAWPPGHAALLICPCSAKEALEVVHSPACPIAPTLVIASVRLDLAGMRSKC